MTKREEDLFETLKDINGGSLAAFERFYETYSGFVYRIALKMTKDEAEAEDICHDVFMEVLDKTDQFDPSRGSLEAWLAVKTKSRCLDRLRRKQRFRMEQWEKAYEQPASYEPVDETVVSRLVRDDLREAINSIPVPQRQAVYGSFFKEMTHRELAEKLNRPLGSVKSLIRYGLRNLKQQISKNGIV